MHYFCFLSPLFAGFFSGTVFILPYYLMRKVLKITLYILGSIIFLLLAAILWLNTPWGQNVVRGKAEAFLNEKLKTEVRIGYLNVGFPKFIVISDILLKDQAKDTLLALHTLKIDIALLKLLHKQVSVQQVVLQGVNAHIYRNAPDTTYNFTYIIDAFAGNNPKKPKVADTAAKKPSAFEINLDRVKLDDIRLRYDDHTGGAILAVNLTHLDLKLKELNLDSMLFHVKGLDVDGLVTTYAQLPSTLPPKVKDTGKTVLRLIADNVHLAHILVNYDDNINNLLFALNLGELVLQLKNFDLAHNSIAINKLAINTTSAMLTMGKNSKPPAVIDTIVKKDSTEGWNVIANELEFAGLNFKMDNENAPVLKKGIDYAHLNLHDVMFNMNQLRYGSDSISGVIKHMALKEKSGINVKELRTAFSYNQQGAILKGLYLLTDHTVLQDYAEVHYPSLDALKKDTRKLSFRVNIEKSIVGFQDILIFAPTLESQEIFHKYPKAQIRLDANLLGQLDKITINRFHLLSMNATEVELNGKLNGLPDQNKINYNIHITRLLSSRKAIEDVVADTLLSAVRIPDRFSIKGNIAGTIKDYNTDLSIGSTDGSAYIKGKLYMSPGKGKETYDMLVQTENLELGHILKKDSLVGAVSAAVTVKGTGFDPKKMTAVVNGAIGKALLKNYQYHDIIFKAVVAAQKGNLILSAADTNFRISLKGDADFSGQYIAAKADILLDSINVQALKLYPTELRARGIIHADFPELNPDYPRGTFSWKQPVVNADGKRYYLDSMYIVSKPTAAGGQDITVDLDVMKAHITGKTPLTKIAPIVQDRINRRYSKPATDSLSVILFNTTKNTAIAKIKKDTATIPLVYDLKLTAQVVDKPLLHSLLPGLTTFDSIHIDGSLTQKNLGLSVTIPSFEYGSNILYNGLVKVSGTDSAFTYKVTADKISSGGFALWYADVHGNLDQDRITAQVSVSDSLKKERFALAARLNKSGDSQIIVLEKGLKLNYDTWQVMEGNRIVMAPGGLYINNFEISNKGQYIRAASEQQIPDAPLKIDIKNFELANITNIASSGDTLLANGILEGSVRLQKLATTAQAEGDLKIKNLSIKGDTLGDLGALVSIKDANTLDAKVTLNGKGNDIGIAGAYYLKPVNGNDLKMHLDVKALNVKSFETIALNQIRDSKGYIRGAMDVEGTINSPTLNGELHTDNLETTVSALNSYFKMPNEKITFSKYKASFNNFNIKDSSGNNAYVNGSIDLEDLTDVGLSLELKATNWRGLHSTKGDNKTFYGDMMITTNLTLNGTAASPIIDGNINILKGTNLTVVTPETKQELESRKGIVVFVNMKDTGKKNFLPNRAPVAAKKGKLAPGSDINVNINIDKSAIFSLIIDQSSGDFISVKGDAYLNASVTPDGTIGLTGNYELHGGEYQLNYNFIKRKFVIKDGSTITFAGDPVKGAIMDVTAEYEANVAPYDLVQRQVTDPAQLNYYKQRIPFEVALHLKGQILKPMISFDVLLPENKVYRLASDQLELIQGKLSQIRMDTSELNKQVFALLILNRFVSDDPFSSGASSSLAFTALQSVSTFIGEQLNQAAGHFVKGVDFSVDLATTEDYTTGDMRQRTDLNLAASKRLLNDRLKLTLGNNFELEGPKTSNEQATYIPSNLAADYQLSPDGKYTLRAYRKAYDEGVLQGYVTETGLDFIVSIDYNKFSSVIKKKKKKPEETITNK